MVYGERDIIDLNRFLLQNGMGDNRSEGNLRNKVLMNRVKAWRKKLWGEGWLMRWEDGPQFPNIFKNISCQLLNIWSLLYVMGAEGFSLSCVFGICIIVKKRKAVTSVQSKLCSLFTCAINVQSHKKIQNFNNPIMATILIFLTPLQTPLPVSSHFLSLSRCPVLT